MAFETTAIMPVLRVTDMDGSIGFYTNPDGYLLAFAEELP